MTTEHTPPGVVPPSGVPQTHSRPSVVETSARDNGQRGSSFPAPDEPGVAPQHADGPAPDVRTPEEPIEGLDPSILDELRTRTHRRARRAAPTRPTDASLDPDDELGAMFAVVLSRDGRAAFLDAQNDKIGEALILEAARSRQPYFVTVRPDIFAVDFDAAATAPTAAQTLADEITAAGWPAFPVKSGNPEFPDRRHVFARIGSAPSHHRLATRAKELHGDVRTTIRPPSVRHRSEGGRSRLLTPTDPLDALVALAPRRRPPSRLRGAAYQIVKAGNPDDRSRAAAQTVLTLCNRGVSKDAILAFLLNPANAAGAKLREKRPAAQLKYFESLYLSAIKKIAAAPPQKCRPAVDVALANVVAQLDAVVRRAGGGANALYVAGRMLVEIGRRAGALIVSPGVRYLAEELGVHRSMATALLRDLAAVAVIEAVSRSGGKWARSWKLHAATSHFTQGGVREVASAPPVVGEVTNSAVREVASFALRPVVPVPCLADWCAADVFGPRGWCGTHGLGFDAWYVLILVESALAQTVPVAVVVHHLGAASHRAIEVLAAWGLVVLEGALCRRGTVKLEAVAVQLRTLGSKTWRRARHLAERSRYRQALLEECSGAVRSISVRAMRDGPLPDGAQAPVGCLPATGSISPVSISFVSNSPASTVADSTVADSTVVDSTVVDSTVVDSTLRTARPVREFVPDEEAFLGDDRDVLSDLAAEVGYCACQLPGGRSIAQGRDAWVQFIACASAGELGQARKELERIKAAVRASDILGNGLSEQESHDDTGWPWELR
jgi:hypothetical protein